MFKDWIIEQITYFSFKPVMQKQEAKNAQKELVSKIIPDLGEIAGDRGGLELPMKYYSVVHLEAKYYVVFILMTTIMKLLVLFTLGYTNFKNQKDWKSITRKF